MNFDRYSSAQVEWNERKPLFTWFDSFIELTFFHFIFRTMSIVSITVIFLGDGLSSLVSNKFVWCGGFQTTITLALIDSITNLNMFNMPKNIFILFSSKKMPFIYTQSHNICDNMNLSTIRIRKIKPTRSKENSIESKTKMSIESHKSEYALGVDYSLLYFLVIRFWYGKQTTIHTLHTVY